jgi:hypothetical protein
VCAAGVDGGAGAGVGTEIRDDGGVGRGWAAGAGAGIANGVTSIGASSSWAPPRRVGGVA